MNTTITIDRAGRVVLPKQVRQELHLENGEPLELESFDDHIVLRPVRAKLGAFKKEGIWVFGTGAPLRASVVDETIRKIRKERVQDLMGTEE